MVTFIKNQNTQIKPNWLLNVTTKEAAKDVCVWSFLAIFHKVLEETDKLLKALDILKREMK